MLVGRKQELRQVSASLAARGSTVLVGEAGVGKTSLARGAAADSGLELVEAGSFATLSWLAYLPFRRALGRDPVGGDPAYVAREVEDVVGSRALLVDDLHWADEQSREVVGFLVGRIPLVATLRLGAPGAAGLAGALAESGCELVELEPLPGADASELALRLRPDLAPRARERLVVRSGGNPLLLEELAASGEATESLELALAARVRQLPPAAREALGLLALAGRPLPGDLLPGTDELARAGLVIPAVGGLAFRHPLLGEVVAARLDAGERQRLHARLARLVDHPGEAARHHAAAGERSLAHEAALAAAAEEAPPGELAAHLEVAASCSDGADAQVLRLRAAALLVQVGRFAAAESLLDLVQSGSARVQAEVCLLRGRAAAGDHDLDRAGACFASGRALARSAGSPVALELEVEALALELELYADAVAATVLDAALDLPVPAAGSAAVPAALHALIGQARRLLGEPGWEDDTARSLAAARRAGATGDECRIAETTIGALFHEGAAPRARRLARTYRSRSAELRLASWERRFRTRAAWLSMHGGRYPHAHDEAERLLTEPLEWERFLVVYVAAESAVDLGLHDRASELLAELYVLSTSGHERLRQALWVRADVELWSGRPAAALATVDELLARFPHEQSTFARLTRAWACVETGVDPGSASIGPTVPLLAAAPTELLALSSLYRGEDEAAARLFADAASVWRGQHERGRLRCAWAAGEALRRAGRTDSALIQLERAERLVEAYRQRPILSRVHRSLRLLGARRSSERSAGRHGLTAREAEILGLVGEGRSNAEIARRLGLGRPTVDRLVASATGKLGARTRLQAAALAARP